MFLLLFAKAKSVIVSGLSWLKVKLFSVRGLVWVAIYTAFIAAVWGIKILLKNRQDRTTGILDDQLTAAKNKMATVEADALQVKAEAKATTEDHISRINAAASEEDPVERRRKLAEELNSL
jgi:hypothetical protein